VEEYASFRWSSCRWQPQRSKNGCLTWRIGHSIDWSGHVADRRRSNDTDIIAWTTRWTGRCRRQSDLHLLQPWYWAFLPFHHWLGINHYILSSLCFYLHATITDVVKFRSAWQTLSATPQTSNRIARETKFRGNSVKPRRCRSLYECGVFRVGIGCLPEDLWKCTYVAANNVNSYSVKTSVIFNDVWQDMLPWSHHHVVNALPMSTAL